MATTKTIKTRKRVASSSEETVKSRQKSPPAAPEVPVVNPPEAISGFLDWMEGKKIGGWARGPVSPVSIHVMENGNVIHRDSASLWRADIGDHVGFIVDLDIPGLASKILDKVVTFHAVSDSGSIELPIYDELRRLLITERFIADIPVIGPNFLQKALKKVQDYVLGGNRDYAIWQVLDGTPRDEMTTVTLPVGLLSLDHNVAVGRNGHLFLVGGTNKLLDQYSDDKSYESVAADVARKWFDTILSRKAKLEGAGIRFIQCIIPEKISLLTDMFPRPIANKTVIMRKLEDALQAEHSLHQNYISGIECLSQPAIREEAFQKLDTHLAPIGAYVIANEIGRRLNSALIQGVTFDDVLRMGGDLGRRIASPHARGPMPSPTGPTLRHLESGVQRVEFYAPPTTFIGTRAIYRNDLAPNPERVVVFGNSFFQNGENATHISWWMARMYREFHFIWSPEVDYDYVERVKPDIVVCQTIERFLARNAKS